MKSIPTPDLSILVAIDIQDRLVPAMAANLWPTVLRHQVLTLKSAALLDVPTLLTEQYPRGLGETIPEIADAAGEAYTKRIIKSEFSCMANEGFRKALGALVEGRTIKPQVILIGIESHVCVLQTAFDLLDEGFPVAVIEDGLCSRQELNHKNALHQLRQAGVRVTNSESVVFGWLRDSKNSRFKEVSALVKAADG